MTIDYRLIGQKIQLRRKALHKTQENVAESISVTVGYISQIERGITKVNLETLSLIAEVLGCDIMDFLGGATVNASTYLANDLNLNYSKLSAINKKALLEISEVLLKNQLGA